MKQEDIERQADEFFATKPMKTTKVSNSAVAVGSGVNFREGIWFRSAVSGMMYDDHAAAGDIDIIYVNGVLFDRRGSLGN